MSGMDAQRQLGSQAGGPFASPGLVNLNATMRCSMTARWRCSSANWVELAGIASKAKLTWMAA